MKEGLKRLFKIFLFVFTLIVIIYLIVSFTIWMSYYITWLGIPIFYCILLYYLGNFFCRLALFPGSFIFFKRNLEFEFCTRYCAHLLYHIEQVIISINEFEKHNLIDKLLKSIILLKEIIQSHQQIYNNLLLKDNKLTRDQNNINLKLSKITSSFKNIFIDTNLGRHNCWEITLDDMKKKNLKISRQQSLKFSEIRLVLRDLTDYLNSILHPDSCFKSYRNYLFNT